MNNLKSSIIVPVITQLVEEARAMVAAVRDAEALVDAYDRKLVESRDIAKARRMELGMLLRKAREQLPKRGTDTNGFTAFLGAIEMSESTAYRYMEESGWVSGRALSPSVGDSGRDASSGPDAPPPLDEDIPADEPAPAAAPEVEIDRDTWCTPAWLTEAIGKWDLDPCANERSHVQTVRSFMLEARGEDGLELAAGVKKTERVFLNPPYSDVTPWIEAYAHTRFCFLLKFDPSTKWFSLLMQHVGLVLFPRGTRIEFEAPPGVPPEKSIANPFPHALFFARRELATKAIKKLCHVPWMPR